VTIPTAVDVRFHKWELRFGLEGARSGMKTATVFWHFARGMAFAGKGKASEAEAEYKIVSDAEKATPPDVIFPCPSITRQKTS